MVCVLCVVRMVLCSMYWILCLSCLPQTLSIAKLTLDQAGLQAAAASGGERSLAVTVDIPLCQVCLCCAV
jgi:hypothetical protein